MSNEELLKVLDMSEPIKALYELGYTEYFVRLRCGRDGTTCECKTGSLAGLAFRLRDEARKCSDEALVKAWAMVYHYDCPDARNTAGDVYIWWLWNAKPIHWVIASLIAKGERNKDMPPLIAALIAIAKEKSDG